MALGGQRRDVLKIVFVSAGSSVILGILAGLGLRALPSTGLSLSGLRMPRVARSFSWPRRFCCLAWLHWPACYPQDAPPQSIL